MSSSEDSHSYNSYDFENHEDFGRPPLIKKKSRLIAAVVQNDVDLLKELLDAPKWYNTKDKKGYTLLQIAILRNNTEVFDYMLSIPDFPFDSVNKKNETALTVSLCGYVRPDVWTNEHFAYELLKKGASIEKVSIANNTPLLCAIVRSYTKVAKILIDAQKDVDVCGMYGYNPLDVALARSNWEIVLALLKHVTKGLVDLFVISTVKNAPISVQETLFLKVKDTFPEVEISLELLLHLAKTESQFFHEIVNYPIKIKESDDNKYTLGLLCSVNIDNLKIVIEKFGCHIREVFAKAKRSDVYSWKYDKPISIEHLSVMLSTHLRSDVVHFINTLNTRILLQNVILSRCGESVITELYCFLLSYGLSLNEWDLQIVYQNFGYCELFKIMLHMDVRMNIGEYYFKSMMPNLIYDITMNVEELFQDPYKYSKRSTDEVLSYFASPVLRQIHYKLVNEGIVKKRENLPQVPLLVELSRNTFRKFFIETFQIKATKEFYSLLKALPISTVHKKIITYETKLY